MTETVAVVVTYNRKELLKDCIMAICNQTYKVDIIVIDNNSTDGTDKLLNELSNSYCHSNIKHINTHKNLGGAGGFAFGVKEAVKAGYKFVWLMDDDCEPKKDCLEILMKACSRLNGNFGFLASKVLWKDQSICKMNIPRRTLSKSITKFEEGLYDIKIASFVSLLIPTSVVKAVGLPIKDFFIWVDDWEYTKRISKKFNSYYVGTSVVVHKTLHNNGPDISTESEDKLSRFYYMYRNSVFYYKQEGLYGYIYLFLRNIKHIINVLIKAPNCKRKRCSIIIESTREGMGFNPEIEYADDTEKNSYS